MKTKEDYQAAINLTHEQEKAFVALKRAIAKCRKICSISITLLSQPLMPLQMITILLSCTVNNQ